MTNIKNPKCGWEYFMQNPNCTRCKHGGSCDFSEESEELLQKQKEKQRDIEMKQNKQFKEFIKE